MSRRVFDESFRKMAIELSYSRGSVKEVADELGISQTLLSKWRQRESESFQGATELTEDQKLIKKLQKELKDAQMERDILKKAVGIFS
ncbi:transposase, partial [Pedobacter soli]